MKNIHHAIIGAGLAGLACANRLQTAGQKVEIFEKARGPGGRLSSRRRLNTTIDLGCQQLNASTPEFNQQLKLWQKQGWVASHNQQSFYGIPRMSGLTRHLSQSLKLHLATRITCLHKQGKDWWLEDELGKLYGPYQQITLATPAAQALPLIAKHSTQLSQQIAKAKHLPCWVAYFILPKNIAVAESPQSNSSQPLSRWTLLNNKPEQQAQLSRWVVQASPEWSQAHQDLNAKLAAQKLFAHWCNDAALSLVEPPLLLEAHRWLYAFTSQPLGIAYLQDLAQGLNVCGDYCLGSLAEDAWLSGDKLGKQLIKTSN